MPSYDFQCKKCDNTYEVFLSLKECDNTKGIKCPSCKSKSKVRLFGVPNIKFANPRESSRWDNFSYRAGKTMEEAQECRRNAEEKSHVGPNPYGDYNAQVAADINNDANWGEVK
jgi:putative FmdB family regulatory protein